MKLRQLFLLFFIGAAVCISSPALGSTILFFDDLNAAPGSPLSSIPTVGTWTLTGDPDKSLVTAFGATPTDYFACSIRSTDNGWNSIDATFTEQTNATDVVRLEADVYGAGGTAHLSMYSSAGEYLAYVLLYTDGQVLVPGGYTGQTFNQDVWNHVAIEYSPGATTFDLYVNDQPMATSTLYGSPANINQIRFANTTSTNWTFVDNVTVTAVPEPSTLALLACGLFGLLACGRRRR